MNKLELSKKEKEKYKKFKKSLEDNPELEEVWGDLIDWADYIFKMEDDC